MKEAALAKANCSAWLALLSLCFALPCSANIPRLTEVGLSLGQWRTTLDIAPGAHQLSVTAHHSSGQFATNAVSWFTNSAATDRAINGFDAAGQLTQKVWLSSNGTTNRTQTLYWDAKGRLWKVVERDSGNSGNDWTAVYDAFDRRLRTTAITVTNGVALSAQPKTINQFYDPMVEFLEVGVSYDNQTTWKLHGPDLNGSYGGMQGVGGLEAVQTGYSQPVVLISDVRGNVLQQYDTWTRTVTYAAARPTGYGAAPGYEPVALGYGASFGEAASWRGKWRDVTGYYWVGRRYYGPQSGSWLSYDSAWNVRDPNWFTFCGDDPINYFDPLGEGGLNVFQVLAPATYSATGARPYSGSLAGDVRVAGGFYAATLPVQAPGRIYTSEPVQRTMQVVGGASEVVAGAYAIPGSGGLGTGLGIAAIGHGFDSIQAGIRGDQSFTAQGLTHLTGSPMAGNLLDAGLGIGLNFGAGIAASRIPASSSVTHFTSPENFGAIGQSQRLGAPYGVFAVESAQAPSSWLGRMLLTGSVNNSKPLVLTGEATGAFSAPPLVGPISELLAAFGVRSSPLGSIDMSTGQFVSNEIFRSGVFSPATAFDQAAFAIHQSVVNYLPDALFGVGRMAGAYADGLTLQATQQPILGKKH